MSKQIIPLQYNIKVELYLKITNKKGERLDTLIEGNEKSTTTVIFVHGFATDKHETAHYFDDIAKKLKGSFRIVRFDLSGCGKSEGRTEDIDYEKHADDLESVIHYIKKIFPGYIFILAQSMGCFITALLNPKGIKKTVFTGLPNSNTKFIADRLISRFGTRPSGHIDFEGMSIFPRSSGANQKIGPSFWKVLFDLNPVEKVKNFAKNTKLLVIHPRQDEIVGSQYLSEYAAIPDITIIKMDGDHSFKNLEDRKKLIDQIQQFFDHD